MSRSEKKSPSKSPYKSSDNTVAVVYDGDVASEISMPEVTVTVAKKFAHSAGIGRLSPSVLPLLRSFIANKLYSCINAADIFAMNARRKTIMPLDVEMGLKTMHVDLAVTTGNPACTDGGFKSKERKILHQIKNVECLVFAKASFERMLRNILKYVIRSEDNHMLSANVGEIVQLYVEGQVRKLMKDARLMLDASERSTLMAEDVSSVLKVYMEKRV